MTYPEEQTFTNEPASDEVSGYGPPGNAGSLPMSIVGAILGAGLGAVIWFMLERYAGVQIGYVAVACGAFAGIGAVKLGGRTGIDVGMIAATAGLAGIIVASYASFHTSLRGDEARAEVASLAAEMEGYGDLAQTDRERAVDTLHQQIIAEVGYFDSFKGKDFMFMALFGGFGVWYGFRTGVGGEEESA